MSSSNTARKSGKAPTRNLTRKRWPVTVRSSQPSCQPQACRYGGISRDCGPADFKFCTALFCRSNFNFLPASDDSQTESGFQVLKGRAREGLGIIQHPFGRPRMLRPGPSMLALGDHLANRRVSAEPDV